MARLGLGVEPTRIESRWSVLFKVVFVWEIVVVFVSECFACSLYILNCFLVIETPIIL